jgi:histidinol dehydrogenase
MIQVVNNPERKLWSSLCERPQIELESLESSVNEILKQVTEFGDQALRDYAAKFDKATLTQLQVTDNEIEEAIALVDEKLKQAIALAAANIKKFHAAQRREVVEIETMPGVVCWRKGVAIEKVGIYIPGGSAPLFSTLLMLGIPALLAGCKEIIVCTPPSPNGNINPAILYAAYSIGLTKIYKVGGAQAIAALSVGTESILKVNKIFGPGNQYVTKAKQLVSLKGTAIDMPAGPSEVLVMADEFANADFVAADSLAQAEHGSDSQVVLVTSSKALIPLVQQALVVQLEKLPRREIAQKAIENSRILFFTDQKDAIDFVNEYAPEHLIINTKDYDSICSKIINAGSIFLGAYTPESAGDYASGTNHTLPTNGYAKAYSGVSLDSFLKFITYQRITKEGINAIGPAVESMAEAEELIGHKEAISIRLKYSSE